MSPKRKQQKRRGWNTFKKRLAAIPVVASLTLVVGATVAYFNYKYSGADDLRNKVYSPLNSELSLMESSLLANSISQPFSGTALESLKKSGDFYRLPRSLQNDVGNIYGGLARPFQHTSITEGCPVLVPPLFGGTGRGF
jgi:hypothetical protein